MATFITNSASTMAVRASEVRLVNIKELLATSGSGYKYYVLIKIEDTPGHVGERFEEAETLQDAQTKAASLISSLNA